MGLRLGVLGLESNHQSNLVYDKSSGMTSSHVNTEFCPWYLVDWLVFAWGAVCISRPCVFLCDHLPYFLGRVSLNLQLNN